MFLEQKLLDCMILQMEIKAIDNKDLIHFALKLSLQNNNQVKGKGFSDRIFTMKCSPGSPPYDISEVINDAGDP